MRNLRRFESYLPQYATTQNVRPTLTIFNKSQRYRYTLLPIRSAVGSYWNDTLYPDSSRTLFSGKSTSTRKPSTVQRTRDSSCFHYDFLHGNASDDWWIWKLIRAYSHWCARHGFSTPQQPKFLTTTSCSEPTSSFFVCGSGSRNRLNCIPST